MDSYNNLEKILEKIAGIDFSTCEKNYFDVAGYPHYENVISNILSFFFKNEDHRLKDLWLKSLLECYKEVVEKNNTINALDFDQSFNEIDVRREVKTNDESRIDLLIQTNDFSVIIENKIYSGVHNPFSSYHNYIIKEDNELPIYEILLTLYKENNQINEKEGYAFYNITYDKLINRVKKNLGKYINDSNDKWLIYMKEFMNNISNLGSGNSMETNKELNKLIEDNNDMISDFFENYFKEVEARIELINNITEKVKSQLSEGFSVYDYNTTLKISKGSSYCSAVVDIEKERNTLVVETYVMKVCSKEEYEKGNILYVALWKRNNKNYDYSKQLKLIEGIKGLDKPIPVESSGWGKHYILKEYNLSKDINIEDVVKTIVSISKAIKE